MIEHHHIRAAYHRYLSLEIAAHGPHGHEHFSEAFKAAEANLIDAIGKLGGQCELDHLELRVEHCIHPGGHDRWVSARGDFTAHARLRAREVQYQAHMLRAEMKWKRGLMAGSFGRSGQ